MSMNDKQQEKDFLKPKGWWNKFANAIRGIFIAVHGQSSFPVFCVITVLVVITGFWLEVSIAQWGVLVLCVAVVFAAETFNCALELLAQAIDRKENPLIGRALDAGAGAVLMSSIGAAIVGIVIFAAKCADKFHWW